MEGIRKSSAIESTVSHWPFSDQFHCCGWPNLLYIFNINNLATKCPIVTYSVPYKLASLAINTKLCRGAKI